MPNRGMGPWSVLGGHGQTGHRYFGWAKVFSENCKKPRTYWIHFIHGSKDSAWVSEMEKESEGFYSHTGLLEEDLKKKFSSRTPIS